MSNGRPMRLGDKLLDEGLITPDQLRIALTEQKRTKEPLGKLFISLGFVTDAVIRDALGEASGQDSIDLTKVLADGEAIKLISKPLALRYKVIPITFDREKHSLTLAMGDIFDVVALDKVHAALGGSISVIPLATDESQIADAIDRFYGFELSVDGILHELETGELDYNAGAASGDEFSQPLVRLVNALLADAVKRSASDIHFEPEPRFLRVRYRIDGVLRQIRILHINYWAGMVVRLKVIGDMNIAETRAPQDGRVSLNLSGHSVDFRISSHPTTHGENIVLRVLDRQNGIVPLAKLGLPPETLSSLELMMARPEGIILVVGPTGSGKTTTLYSVLNHLNTESVHIMTLEDPVEYPMTMIRQTSVNEAAKMDFANGIRSILRQDPDIILVGEVRDEDTADMAFRAAMTGHRVFSTLHTNSALGTIPRLLDIGVKPSIIAGNIIGVVGQRLVRRLCPHCKQPYEPNALEKRMIYSTASRSTIVPIYRSAGCRMCDMSGYKGRVALMEVLRFNSEIDELIASNSTMRELKKTATANGFKTLANDGARRVREGVTSLEEVSRVVDLTQLLSED